MSLNEFSAYPLQDNVGITRCYLNSGIYKTPISIENLIDFLKEVSNKYVVESLSSIELERYEDGDDLYEHVITCAIDIKSRKQDIDMYEFHQKKQKEQRRATYLSLKKEFEEE